MADTPEDLILNYGDKIKPQTYTFISANVYDNPVLVERDPDYVARLENLKRSERARLLEGSWYVREEASKYFKREYLTMIDAPPISVQRRVRCWDFAYTLPSEVYRNPDWTASVLMSRSSEGVYTIENATRFRKTAAFHAGEIIEQARFDGIDEVQIYLPKETAAGKGWTHHLSRELSEAGIPVKFINSPTHSGKLARFRPFASLAENGHVQMVKGPWNEWLLAEMEAFDGSRNTGDIHDDGVDCVSDCTLQLIRGAHMTPVVLSNANNTRQLFCRS